MEGARCLPLLVMRPAGVLFTQDALLRDPLLLGQEAREPLAGRPFGRVRLWVGIATQGPINDELNVECFRDQDGFAFPQIGWATSPFAVERVIVRI